jgi:hypothetical protein
MVNPISKSKDFKTVMDDPIERGKMALQDIYCWNGRPQWDQIFTCLKRDATPGAGWHPGMMAPHKVRKKARASIRQSLPPTGRRSFVDGSNWTQAYTEEGATYVFI